jgi:hypothetical protein
MDIFWKEREEKFLLGCSSRYGTKYFFLTVHYSFGPIIAQQAGQEVMLGRLSLSMFL